MMLQSDIPLSIALVLLGLLLAYGVGWMGFCLGFIRAQDETRERYERRQGEIVIALHSAPWYDERCAFICHELITGTEHLDQPFDTDYRYEPDPVAPEQQAWRERAELRRKL